MLRDLLRKALVAKLHGSKDVAILYSGGFESFSCLCLCKDLGVVPHLYTFYLEGIESYDIRKARNDAQKFGCELTEIVVPNDYETLKKDVYNIISKFGVARKTVVQCLHPMIYTIPKIKEKYVVVGLERGRPWGLNQKGETAGRKSKEAFDKYRKFAVEEQTRNSIRYICELIDESHICVRPYDDDDVDKWFMDRTFKELNHPHAKQPILDEFCKEVSFCGMPLRHASYQVESKIREFHDKLLDDMELNPNGKYKSITGVYNNILRTINSNAQVQLSLEFK